MLNVRQQKQRKELTKQFEAEVTNRADEVDPDHIHHWESLTMGWAIAKGLHPEEAYDFAIYIRYETELG